MEYRLSVNNNAVPVEVETSDDGSLSISIGGVSHRVSFSTINDHHIWLNINGKGINAYVCGSHDEKSIVINGVKYVVADADALEKRGPRKTQAGKACNEVMSPMPAVVVRVMVKEGDVVEKGQALIVVSAMKMESTLGAPFGGKIIKINTHEGAKVMPGQILVDIEKEGAD